MKKIFLFLTLIFTVLSVGGCSDFGFNPTGHWAFVSDNLYANDELIDSANPENIFMLGKVTMVFEKSGTGYIDVDGFKSDFFRYSYDDKTITVTYLPDEHHSDEVTVKFNVSQVDSTIYRTTTKDQKDSDNNSIHYEEIFTYKRV